MPSARLRSAGAAGAVGVPCHASRGARVGRGSRKGRARGGRELSFEFVILIDGNEVKRGVGIAAETIRYGRCVFMFRLEASARPVTRPADSPLVQLVSSSLNPALSLSSDLRAHSTSDHHSSLMSETYRIRPSVPQPRIIRRHAPLWPIPPRYRHDAGRACHDAGRAHNDAKCAHGEVAHCRQRSPLSSQAEPAFSTLSSSQAPVPPYAPFTVAARIHSRRPPPPASTRPLPPSRAAPSRAAPSRAAPSLDGSLGTEALGTAPDRCIAGGLVAQHGARRSSRRWRVQRVARHSPSAAVWRSNRTNISRPSRL